jgi:hypothetical protein
LKFTRNEAKEENMSVIYISGPMRGKHNHNREEFQAVENRLMTFFESPGPGWAPEGAHKIINPCLNFGGRVDLPTTEYLNEDLKQVLEADIIVQLPGWQASEGAMREAQLGVWAGKQFVKAESYGEYRISGTDDYAPDWRFEKIDSPEFSTSPRASVCDEGKQLITGDRNNTYGPPTQDFQRTASMATAFGFQVNGEPLESHHVAIFMILLKMSRLAWTPAKRDSWVDTIGYAGCGFECALTEEQERLNAVTIDRPGKPSSFDVSDDWSFKNPDDKMVAVKRDDLITVLRDAEGFVGGKDNESFARLSSAAGCE